MHIQFAGRSEASIYHVLTQTAIPRPIAWVLTGAAVTGVPLNVAPFSFFTPIASDPPQLAFSIGNRLAGREKDTDRNSPIGAPVVIHIPNALQAEAVTLSARPLPPEESELPDMGRDGELVDWDFPLPRLAECPVAYGGIVTRRIELGSVPGHQVLVIVEASCVWVRDSAYEVDAEGRTRIDPLEINPLSRLGSGRFATTWAL